MSHQDLLAALNENRPLPDKLRRTHEVLRDRVGAVAAVAVALHEPEDDCLRAVVSTDAGPGLHRLDLELSAHPALAALVRSHAPVLAEGLPIAAGAGDDAGDDGAGSPGAVYALPMIVNDTFFGFVLFGLAPGSAPAEEELDTLDLFGHLLTLVVVNEVGTVRTLLAAIRTAREMTHERDPETGGHLERMARYARLIALELAEDEGFDDEYVEHVFMFAPLHDIGKLAIPDRILLKPDRLTDAEYREMRAHVTKGRDLVDGILANFGLDSVQHIGLLRNIVLFHHEAVDGSGYPEAREGEEIPIESRIVSVADVFDALTSRRPYKEPWSNDEAFADLRRLAGVTLDPRCVAALERRRAEVERIQARFAEDARG